MTNTTTAVMELPKAPLLVSDNQAKAWVALATEKNRIAYELQKIELQAQRILLEAKDSTEYGQIDTALAEYRKAHTALVETRKPFTNTLDSAIVQPLMAFEKRVDPKVNAEYLALTNRSLTLRRTETEVAATLNAKNVEISSFKAHVSNEFYRIAAEYRWKIRQEIEFQYELHLNNQCTPDLTVLKQMLSEIPQPIASKFDARYLVSGEMMEIYLTLQKPDWPQIYSDMMDELDQKFANFDSDMANAEAALQHSKEQAALTEMAELTKLNEETAINTLIVSSDTVVIDTPKIKKLLTVSVIESEQWAKSVIAAFVTNLPRLGKYIRVRSWSKLNIGQMAEYLGKLATDEGISFQNLTLNEVEK